ncbi:Cro protein [Mycobacterium phage ShroomBoi]|nr:Cro protein [Mycobacterium phage ShroomBoi]
MLARTHRELLRFALVRSTVGGMVKQSYGVWQELRIIRERTGWSSAELSRESGVSAPYLSQLENGDRWPNATVTKKLAVALKVPVSVLERPAEQKNPAA